MAVVTPYLSSAIVRAVTGLSYVSPGRFSRFFSNG